MNVAPPQDMPEWMMLARVLFAFLLVVSLIYLSSFLVKKCGLDKRLTGVKGKEPTLEVVESLYLDPRRRLVLVRAGAKKHLLLLSASGDMLVSSDEEGSAYEKN